MCEVGVIPDRDHEPARMPLLGSDEVDGNRPNRPCVWTEKRPASNRTIGDYLSPWICRRCTVTEDLYSARKCVWNRDADSDVQPPMRKLIAGVLCLCSGLAAEASQSLCAVPVQVRGSAVWVPVQVNGKGFLFDTAAGWHCLNSRLAGDLRLNLREYPGGAQGAGDGRVRSAEVLGAKLRLGDLELPFAPAAAIDLDSVAARRGEDLDGLLGAPLLRRYMVEVDLEAAIGRLAVEKRTNPKRLYAAPAAGFLAGALSCFFCSSCFCFVTCCCLLFSLSFFPPLSPIPAPSSAIAT